MLNYCLLTYDELSDRQSRIDNIGVLSIVELGDSILSEQIKIGDDIIFELKTSLN